MKNYLIHIQLQLQERTSQENTQIGSLIKSVIEQHTESHTNAYISGDQIGYLVRSEKTANFLRMAIDGNSPVQKTAINTGFRHGDRVMVVELGTDISENGYSVAKTWLNRRAK